MKIKAKITKVDALRVGNYSQPRFDNSGNQITQWQAIDIHLQTFDEAGQVEDSFVATAFGPNAIQLNSQSVAINAQQPMVEIDCQVYSRAFFRKDGSVAFSTDITVKQCKAL